MNDFDQRQRYLELHRQQLRRELEEMGYGRRARSVTVQGDDSNMADDFVRVTLAAVVLALSITATQLLA